MPGAHADIENGYVTDQSLAPQNRTATENGSSVDFQDCGPEVTVEVNIGVHTGGTVIDVTLEESSDESSWSAITGAAMASIDAADSPSNTVAVETFYNRAQRYVRAVATLSGGSADSTFGVTLKAPRISY